LLIGTEGSGKTSTFVHSGLEPKLLAGQVYKEDEIMKTPLCNIWLANGAIFVELSGKLLGQPSECCRLLTLLKPQKASFAAHVWGRREGTPTYEVLCSVVMSFRSSAFPIRNSSRGSSTAFATD